MGFVPIHVHMDIPWVPYMDIFQEVGFIAHVDDLNALVATQLKLMTVENIQDLEDQIVALRESHFSTSGLMIQIQKFMTGQESDLRCQSLPNTIRSA